MINVEPLQLENGVAIGVSVSYPKTTLLSIVTTIGYVMCGVLNIEALDKLHKDREIIAARITGVKSFQDLLNEKVVEATVKACSIGICEGMTGREALNIMLQQAKRS
jgi:uncharacterized protein YunC (DUF1805 family)